MVHPALAELVEREARLMPEDWPVIIRVSSNQIHFLKQLLLLMQVQV